MPKCERCGNDYDKAFRVEINGASHTFDSFECAIAACAPKCAHCGTHIIGHGVEADGAMYCCKSCAAAKGVQGIKDRSDRGRSAGA
jgi:uncharacterized radical SAM superfamily protein